MRNYKNVGMMLYCENKWGDLGWIKILIFGYIHRKSSLVQIVIKIDHFYINLNRTTY